MIAPTIVGAFRLAPPIPEGRYESALVFAVDNRLHETVLKLRRTLPYSALEEFQLEPHLTVLYLGTMRSKVLLELWEGLQALKPQFLRLQSDGFGVFRRGNTITNLHIRVRSSVALMALHNRALETCRSYQWAPSTKYIGSRYVPHVSVFDRVEISSKGFRLPDDALLPSSPIMSDLHQIAKCLSTPCKDSL